VGGGVVAIYKGKRIDNILITKDKVYAQTDDNKRLKSVNNHTG
jgi:hypothetical protein